MYSGVICVVIGFAIVLALISLYLPAYHLDIARRKERELTQTQYVLFVGLLYLQLKYRKEQCLF